MILLYSVIVTIHREDYCSIFTKIFSLFQALENTLERMLTELQKAHQALEVAYLKRCRSSLLLKASRIGIEEVQDRLVRSQEALRTALVCLSKKFSLENFFPCGAAFLFHGLMYTFSHTSFANPFIYFRCLFRLMITNVYRMLFVWWRIDTVLQKPLAAEPRTRHDS